MTKYYQPEIECASQEQIKAWEAENPLEMCRDRGMTPQMIMILMLRMKCLPR